MIDLMIPLASDKSAPYYEQIYCFIKEMIHSGRIQAGERLPATRQLAVKLGVSRSTTQMAYDQLAAEGYLIPKAGSGYYAAELSLIYQDKNISTERSARKAEISVSDRPQEEQKDVIDFSPRGIDLAHFPFNTWRKLSREVLQEENRDLFASGEARGEWNLREQICSYLQASRGILCDPSQLLIGAGSEYLLMLLTQLLGLRKIAMENVTYLQAGRVLQRLGHQVVPVEMDGSGMRCDHLRESEADMAYIMPSHQFPTGIVMPQGRREEILRWAAESENRYVIEDDYDSEFRYRGKPIPALCGFDNRGKVIYLGTFSKSVAPAIRMSFMVLPEKLSRKYEETCGFYASTVSRLDQEILWRFMEQGHFERHLNRMRGLYRGKHDCLLNEVEPLKKTFLVGGELAGLHILLRSKEGRREDDMIREALAAGVKVYGMSRYLWEEDESHTILLGYANLSEEEIREGIARLRKIWK